MTPIECVERRLDGLTRAPGMWGSPEAVEMVALSLLDLRSEIGRPVSRVANVFEVFDLWRKAIRAKHGKETTASHSLVTGLTDAAALGLVVTFITQVREALPLEPSPT